MHKRIQLSKKEISKMSWCAWSHENTFSSFQRGKCAACFPFLSFCILAFYQNTIRRICPSASHLSFPQNIRKRDFSFFRKVSFSYPCADERSKSTNLLTCLLIKRQSALLTYFLSALFRILPVEFFGISSISMKCLGILYAAILPFMNFRISFSSSV